MKSDREFIDGIYAKAELKKQPKPPFFNIRRIAAIPMAAAVGFLVWNLGVNPATLKLTEDSRNSANERSMEQIKGRAMVGAYYIEGNVIEVLEPYMGYGRIRVQVNTEVSTLQDVTTVLIAYPDTTTTYQTGDDVTATLIQQQLGTQEYYMIAD